MGSILEYFIINYRWIFVCCFLLPLSLLYDSYYYLRNWLIFLSRSAPKLHDKKVKYVQSQVKQWRKLGSTVPMCTARPGWQTMSLRVAKYKNTMFPIHIDLVDILEVNTDKQYVRVEPMVTIGQLTATLNPLGWTIPIVPELDDLTLGGMINGTGVESSSHIYGLLQHICLSYELVMADGCVVRCSKDENEDLFTTIPWSHGTLGLLVAAEIKMIPCKKYVKLEYIPLYSKEDVVRTLTKESQSINPADFIEGLLYAKDKVVVMLGRMTDDIKPEKVNRIGRFYKPWFYKHVQKYLESGRSGIEYIPIREYYHRHTRSLFWQMQDIVPFGNSPIFRYTMGWSMPPKVSFLKLTQGETIRHMYEKFQFVHDFLIPIRCLREFIDFIDDSIKIYPVWLCPFILPDNPGLVHPQQGKEMYIDVGLYGPPKIVDYDAVKTTRKVEAFVRNLHGFQMLYADSYQNREEFRQMFDHDLYDRMRSKFGCKSAFPEIFDKINKQVRH